MSVIPPQGSVLEDYSVGSGLGVWSISPSPESEAGNALGIMARLSPLIAQSRRAIATRIAEIKEGARNKARNTMMSVVVAFMFPVSPG